MNNSRKHSLSVLMSVYAKEQPDFLAQALLSLARQTLPAEEILIVKDGPLTRDLDDTIAEFGHELPIRVLSLPRNVGLGRSLNAGVLACHTEWIGRMDSDDVCAPDRFEKQMQFIHRYPKTDVLGGAIGEFDTDWRTLERVRAAPTNAHVLLRSARVRNPINHQTAMFRRAAVVAAGNYQPVEGFEDYFLWARMMMAKARIANLPDILVYARCGNGMHGRRGGSRYIREEIRFQLLLRNAGFISYWRCFLNMSIRTPVRLMPTAFRARFYEAVLRTEVSESR